MARSRSGLSTARSSVTLYGQASTFTSLPALGQVLSRGRALYEIDGRPVLLLYGAVVPTRAFVAGMSTGRDVAALNANLGALGYASGLTGDTFSTASAAAVRALPSAHRVAPHGEVPPGA